MTRLFDQISDMQKTLESLEDRVYSGQAAVSGLVTRDNDADEDDDDDRGQFALIFFVILFVIIMTWIFLCCFYCLLRKRETI